MPDDLDFFTGFSDPEMLGSPATGLTRTDSAIVELGNEFKLNIIFIFPQIVNLINQIVKNELVLNFSFNTAIFSKILNFFLRQNTELDGFQQKPFTVKTLKCRPLSQYNNLWIDRLTLRGTKYKSHTE